jgi:hypothetical protein
MFVLLTKMIQSRRMKPLRKVARNGENTNELRVLIGKAEETTWRI